jgi:ParB family chromosome partitioning protein
MAREAARLLEGSNWLPEPLRLDVGDAVADEPAADDVADEDETALGGDAAELPAYLASDTGPSVDEEVPATGEDADHLQAAE